MMGILYIVTASAVCFSLPVFYGARHGKTLPPAVWVAWGWICGVLVLEGAVCINSLAP